MRERLEKIIAAYQELEQKLMDPAVVSNPKEYARLAKEHASQGELVTKAREYLQALDDIEAAKEMLHEAADADEKAMLQEDISANEEKLRAALASLNEVLEGIDSDNSSTSDEDKPDDSKTGEQQDKKLAPNKGRDAEAEKAERLNVIKSARELVTGGKDNKETK